jgi:hypothetical protein
MRRYLHFLAAFLLLWTGLAGLVQAHELQPSSMELRQLTSERFEVIWRAPVYYGKPHPAQLQLPKTWQTVGEPTVKQLPDSALYRHVVDVPGGAIDGAVIHFVGLESTITDVFARIVWLDGSETTAIARPSQPWIEVIAQRSAWQVAWDYTVLGVDHILSGFDHLTFVLALLLIVSGARRLLITVTAFTFAHSITLAAATLGVLWVPPAAERGTACTVDVQRRCRTRATPVYRGHPRNRLIIEEAKPRMASLARAGASLRYRRHRRLLADRARRWFLIAPAAPIHQGGRRIPVIDWHQLSI